ncbi:MAG: discoidin domain-containing protein [Candidatus Omnitrophica bacterium]|nr:discoidin domain-containing protein [Candidatus Omnitrophota bacterium]
MKKIFLFIFFVLNFLLHSDINIVKEFQIPYKVSVGSFFQHYGRKFDNDLIQYKVYSVKDNILFDKNRKEVGRIEKKENFFIILDDREIKVKEILNDLVIDEKGENIGKFKKDINGNIYSFVLIVNENGDFFERKGLLIDGKDWYAPRNGLCYVFWRVPVEESFVTVEFNLDKLFKVNRIIVRGQNLTGMYGVSKVKIYGSKDGIIFNELKKIDEIVQPTTGKWFVEIPDLNIDVKFLRITVFAKQDKYLDLTECEIWGEKKEED